MVKIHLNLKTLKKYLYFFQNPPFSVLNFIRKTNLSLILAGVIYIIYGVLVDEKLMILLNAVFIGLIIIENLMRMYLIKKLPERLKKSLKIFLQVTKNFYCMLIFILLSSPFYSSNSSPSSSTSSHHFLKGFLSLLVLLLWLQLQSLPSSLLLLSSFLLILSLPLSSSEIILLLLSFLLLLLLLLPPSSLPPPLSSKISKPPSFFSPHLLDQEDLICMMNNKGEVLYKSEKLYIDLKSRRFRVLKKRRSLFPAEEVANLIKGLFSKRKDADETIDYGHMEIWLSFEELLDVVGGRREEEEGKKRREERTSFATDHIISTNAGVSSKMRGRKEDERGRWKEGRGGGVAGAGGRGEGDGGGRGRGRGGRVGGGIGIEGEGRETIIGGREKLKVVGGEKKTELEGKGGKEGVLKEFREECEGERADGIRGEGTIEIGGIWLIDVNEIKKEEKFLKKGDQIEHQVGVRKDDEFGKKAGVERKKEAQGSCLSVSYNSSNKKLNNYCDTSFSAKMEENSSGRDETYYILEMEEGDIRKFVFLVRKGGIFTFILKNDFFFKHFVHLSSELEHKIKVIDLLEHEFRTSLNCIVSMLQTVSHTVDEEMMFYCVSPALTSSMFLLNLINDMVDFMQLEVNHFSLKILDFNLYAILEDTINVISIQSQNRGIKLKLECEPDIRGMVRSDPHRIKQIVTNLLHNALKHTQQGSIFLRARRISSSLLEISVQDTGFGFSNEEQTCISKDLSRVEFSYENNFLTLGLKISSLIAKKLNKSERSLSFISTQNIGSTFKTKKVKGSKNTSYNKSQSSKSSGVSLTKNVTLFFLDEGISKSNYTINFSNPSLLQYQMDKVKNKVNSRPCSDCPFALIIDDNDFNIMALNLLLSKLDVNASFALSVDEGMKKIKDLAERNCCHFFKIIFLDIEMPIKDGFVGYAEISEFYKNSNFDFLNIVAVTAHNPSSDIVKNVETKCGIEVYSKPLSQEGLLLIIKKTLKKYKKFLNGK